MGKAAPLDKTLCSVYCSYYKPNQKEELFCRGYAVVERIARSGRSIQLAGSGPAPVPGSRHTLVKKLCSDCDFHEQDCDFMQNREARPCGGFLLLEQLLAVGMIDLEDVS